MDSALITQLILLRLSKSKPNFSELARKYDADSPYDNDSYVCYDGGYPMDFISTLRMWEERSKEEHPVSEYDIELDAPVYIVSNSIEKDSDEDLPFK